MTMRCHHPDDKTILRREFVLEIDLEADSRHRTRRRRYSVRLQEHTHLTDADPRRWTVSSDDGRWARMWSSVEAVARSRFASEVTRLRARQNEVQERGLYACGHINSLTGQDT